MCGLYLWYLTTFHVTFLSVTHHVLKLGGMGISILVFGMAIYCGIPVYCYISLEMET